MEALGSIFLLVIGFAILYLIFLNKSNKENSINYKDEYFRKYSREYIQLLTNGVEKEEAIKKIEANSDELNQIRIQKEAERIRLEQKKKRDIILDDQFELLISVFEDNEELTPDIVTHRINSLMKFHESNEAANYIVHTWKEHYFITEKTKEGRIVYINEIWLRFFRNKNTREHKQYKQIVEERKSGLRNPYETLKE